jgi:hypothetical protein
LFIYKLFSYSFYMALYSNHCFSDLDTPTERVQKDWYMSPNGVLLTIYILCWTLEQHAIFLDLRSCDTFLESSLPDGPNKKTSNLVCSKQISLSVYAPQFPHRCGFYLIYYIGNSLLSRELSENEVGCAFHCWDCIYVGRESKFALAYPRSAEQRDLESSWTTRTSYNNDDRLLMSRWAARETAWSVGLPNSWRHK